jgi:hypothetical protein
VDGHVPVLAGLGFVSLATDDVNPIATDVNVLRMQVLTLTGPHAREGQNGEDPAAAVVRGVQDHVDLLQRRASAPWRPGAPELGLCQRILSDQLTLPTPPQEAFQQHALVVYRLVPDQRPAMSAEARE